MEHPGVWLSDSKAIRLLFVDFSVLRPADPIFAKIEKKMKIEKEKTLRPLIHIFLPRFSVF